jgi:hypothetical protein
MKEIRDVFNKLYLDGYGGIDGIDEAIDAITALFESRPVDKVQAMALFVGKINVIGGTQESPDIYRVPDVNGAIYKVEVYPDGVNCWSRRGLPCATRDCDHIKAVKLFLEREE